MKRIPLALLAALLLATSPVLAAGRGPAAPLAEQPDAASGLLLAELQGRYGTALGEGELRIRLKDPVNRPVSGVEQMNFDPATRRFAAMLRSNEGERETRFRVDGEVWTEIQVPVPTRRIAAGEVIGEDDLTLVPMRSDQVSGRTLTSAQAMVGMEAKRLLSPGRPVQAGSVNQPVIIQRNKPVTVEFRQGPLLVTARGRALEDAGMGDLVRVQNLDSSRTLTATVTGPGTVSAAE
jgi:flagella basal body P-ring formation protein FlgA